MLRDVYHGEIPQTVEELIKLPGVGRKTANLVCGDIFHVPGVVVADTHCIRISNRLGLCDTKDPYKVEQQLKKLLPPRGKQQLLSSARPLRPGCLPGQVSPLRVLPPEGELPLLQDFSADVTGKNRPVSAGGGKSGRAAWPWRSKSPTGRYTAGRPVR